MNLAREVLADTIETLSDIEVRRAKAQMEAGVLMALETPQGRADQMARSIEVFGRVLTLDELLGDLRAVDTTAAKAAGASLMDGRIAISSVGAPLAAVA
jgi:predicted Zn-dependent peptidase